MMLIIFVMIVLLWQLACYIALEKDNYPRAKGLVLAAVLLGHIYAFPAAYDILFIPPTYCGMPMLAVITIFWFLGALPACILHVVYVLVKRRRMNKSLMP